MRNIKFYISMVMVIGLFFGINSSSFAGERYSINLDNLKRAAKKSIWSEDGKVSWTAKLRNTTEKIQTYKVKVDFLNSNNENIREVTRTATINPNETKSVYYDFTLSASKIREIDSGYIAISKIEEIAGNGQTLTARLDKNIDLDMGRDYGSSIELSYFFKLKNNTDKTMTRNVTVAFLDADNNHVRSETRRATFSAGESKLISDKLIVSASDAGRIATGNVIIN